MAERVEGNDSDAPEEFTSEQGLQQDAELRKVQRESKAREEERESGEKKSSEADNSQVLYWKEFVKRANYLPKGRGSNFHWVVREGKQRRRGWAQKKTPKHTRSHENIRDDVETERNQESLDNGGMLPNEIVKLLASREKQVFVSDSEEENTVKKITSKRKMPKSFGIEPIILKDMPPAQCLQNSVEFLKKRKMLVSRSSSVLNNSNQALRLLSTSGVLSNK